MSKKKDGDGIAPSNVDADGNYIVGKNKPPVASQFKAGDGRRRGRRAKGTRNFVSDLAAELDSRVEITIGGVGKKISRQRAVIMRLADKASRGDTRAIALLFEYQQRLVEPKLAAEQEQQEDYGFDKLTLNEVRVFEYLTGKMSGQPQSAPSIPFLEMLEDRRPPEYFITKPKSANEDEEE